MSADSIRKQDLAGTRKTLSLCETKSHPSAANPSLNNIVGAFDCRETQMNNVNLVLRGASYNVNGLMTRAELVAEQLGEANEVLAISRTEFVASGTDRVAEIDHDQPFIVLPQHETEVPSTQCLGELLRQGADLSDLDLLVPGRRIDSRLSGASGIAVSCNPCSFSNLRRIEVDGPIAHPVCAAVGSIFVRTHNCHTFTGADAVAKRPAGPPKC